MGNKFVAYYFNQEIMSSSNQVRKYDFGHQKKQKNRRINIVSKRRLNYSSRDHGEVYYQRTTCFSF
jgi:hypothetical protein